MLLHDIWKPDYPPEMWADPVKRRRLQQIEREVNILLATDPPSPARFPGQIIYCYLMDDPDPGSARVQCENCRLWQMLGPKSQKIKRLRPKQFHVMCVVCATALAVVHGRMGAEVVTGHVSKFNLG